MKGMNTRIIDEIEKKLEMIQREKGLRKALISLRIHSYNSHSIEKEAITHSFKIEYPHGKTNGYDIPKGRKMIKKGIKNLVTAYNWGRENFDPTSLNENFLKKLSSIIDPFFNGEEVNFRQSSVRVSGATWSPPYPAKLDKEFADYFNNLKLILAGDDISSYLEGASYAHLHLVRIHPFDDGNGRTSRTLQNIILSKKELPPPVIYAGERDNYYEHLDNAIQSWRSRTGEGKSSFLSEGEKSFYDYLAGRVSASLDRILAKIE